MIRCFVFSAFVFYTFSLVSQVSGGSNEKLRELYNLGKFEDCLFKAERLTQSDKTSKDPESYLYMSMCFLEISKRDPQELEDTEFKDPLAESLKSALKFKMKDRKGELLAQNAPYFSLLKQAHVQVVSAAISNGDYRKPVSVLTNLLKLQNDTSILFTKGVCEVLTKSMAGHKSIQQSFDYLSKNTSQDSLFYKKLDQGSQEALMEGAILWTNHLQDQGLEDSAKKVIEVMYQALPESKLVRNKYNKLWGIEESGRPGFKNGAKVSYKVHQSETDIPVEKDLPKNDSLQIAPAKEQ